MPTVTEDYRALAYKLCDQREVPLLVTDLIAGYLDEQHLLIVGTLSRDLNEQANAVIYRYVTIDLDGSDGSVQRATLLFRTLLTNKRAAAYVRSLSLVGEPLVHWKNKLLDIAKSESESIEEPLRDRVPPDTYSDLASFTQAESELYDKVARSSPAIMRLSLNELSVWALCLHILSLATRIEDLSISSDYFRFPDFRSALQDVMRSGVFQKLQRCSLCLDILRSNRRHASAVQDWDQALLLPLVVPEIKSVAAVVTLKPEAVRQLRPGGFSLTRLILHHYQIQPSDLDGLLAVTPILEYLEYHATVDHVWIGSKRQTADAGIQHSTGLEQLHKSLHHVAGSLRELHTTQEFDEDSFHFHRGHAMHYEPPFRQREEMSALKQLHTLTIPYAILLGWTRKKCEWDWDKMLPVTLRKIVLTDNLHETVCHKEWTDGHLMPVIASLLEWLSMRQEDGQVMEFGLRLLQVTHEFNEPVRERLSAMCRGRGIKCSIEKKHEDFRRPASHFHLPRGRGRGTLARGRSRGGAT